MSHKTLHIDELKNRFSDQEVFKTLDLTAFYRELEPEVKKSTINWRVYRLAKMDVLRRLGRGVFTVGKNRTYTPSLRESTKRLFEDVRSAFPYLHVSVWNTSLLNEFMLHQPSRFLTILEVDRDAMESVFEYLKEGYDQVFIKPNKEIVQRYILNLQEAIIIKPLISESPLDNVDGITVPQLEKMLVDIYCDKQIFISYHGSELYTIFEEAFAKYAINEKTLLRYASRRRRKEEIMELLQRLDLLTIDPNS